MSKKFLKILFGFLLTAFLLMIFAKESSAATLSLSPSSKNVTNGDIISFKVIVSTDNKSINDVDSLIVFPSDLLEVLSIDKSSSIFSLWANGPSFSNKDGTISFNGGIPSPGFIGQNGNVLSIIFRAKKQGTASIVFSDSVVLLNDGLGTDVLSSKKSATINITGVSQPNIPRGTIKSEDLPLKPVISSSTHPEQDKWYSSNTAIFSWNVPENTNSIQTILSKNPNQIPTVAYDSSVTQRTVSDLDDGIWYFNIRFVNSAGPGPITQYKIQVDKTPPNKLSISPIGNCEAVNSNIPVSNSIECLRDTIIINASDKFSGIDYYSISIDSQAPFRVNLSDLDHDKYILPPEEQGNHKISIIAYDKARNNSTAEYSYESKSILPPKLSVSPSEIQVGSSLKITGDTVYPNSNVEISIKTTSNKTKSYSVKTDSSGSFQMVSDSISQAGQIQIWSQLVFNSRVKSPLSEIMSVKVNDSTVVQSAKSLLYLLSYIIPLVLLLISLITIAYLGWHKFFGIKNKVREDISEILDDIHHSMSMMKDELMSQLKKLEDIKRDKGLNKKEEIIFKEISSNVDSIEKFIENKLNKIRNRNCK